MPWKDLISKPKPPKVKQPFTPAPNARVHKLDGKPRRVRIASQPPAK